jgi:hypothetical protein
VQNSAYGPVISSGETVGSSIVNAGIFAKTGDAGAGGVSHIAIAITNTGTIEAFDDTLDLEGAVAGGGKMTIENGATLQLDGAVGAQSIGFGSGGGTVVLTDESQFGGGIASFGSGDALDLAGFGYNATTETQSVSGSVLTVTDGTLVAKINLLAQFAAGFHLASDGGGGTLILAGAAPAETPQLAFHH